MVPKLAVLVAALGIASVGLVPSEYMLCFHRDGKIVVEPFQELCCKSTCSDADTCGGENCGGNAASSECPDDQCQDLPLKVTVESTVDTQQPVTDESVGTLITVPASSVAAQVAPDNDSRSASNFLGPPVDRPETLLRTVILRL